MPIKLLTAMRTTSYQTVSMKSMAGFSAKTYGTRKAAMARRDAFSAVRMGEDFAMAEPA